MKVILKGTIVAESEDVVNLEGNSYFPKDSLKKEFFSDSSHTSVCPYKGTANYFNIQEKDGGQIVNAAWVYENSKILEIQGRVAFYRKGGLSIAQ